MVYYSLSFCVCPLRLAGRARYLHGVGVSADKETAAQYALLALAEVTTEYHRIGGQPVLETDRIDDNTEKEVGT